MAARRAGGRRPRGRGDPLRGDALRRAGQQRLVRAPGAGAPRWASRWSRRTTCCSRGGRLRARWTGRHARGGRGLSAHRRGPPARRRRARHLDRRPAAGAGPPRDPCAWSTRWAAGLADDKLVHAYVEEMVRFYLGEEPLLRSVPTYDLGDPEAREEALARLGDLVVKPRDGYGGAGDRAVPPRQSPRSAARFERECARPAGPWSPRRPLPCRPTDRGGRPARAPSCGPATVRVGGGERPAVVPGALTRVAFARASSW